MKNTDSLAKRFTIYIIGIIFVSLGIVLCKKCRLGISPVSSIPFVLELMTPLSFGTWTMIFHFSNTIAQMILTRTVHDIKVWLQFGVAFLFGWGIDFLQKIIVIDTENITVQLLMLMLSVFFTALGMVCMLRMQLIQNPPDGTVRQISSLYHIELGKTKILYDGTCTIAAVMMSLCFLRRIEGFGIATIVSAIFVGKCVTWLQNRIGAVERKNA